MRYKKWVRAAILALFLTIAYLVFRQGVTLGGVRSFVESFGVLGMAAFVLTYAVLATLLVPGTVLTVIGGLLYGTVLGTALNVVGATIGATIAFFISRRLGRDAFQFVVRGRLKELQARVREREVESVLILRLLPLVPFNVLNYGLGLTTVRTWQYVIATFFGIIPAAFVYTFAADRVGELLLTEGFSSLTTAQLEQLILPVALLVLVSIVPFVWQRVRKHRRVDT